MIPNFQKDSFDASVRRRPSIDGYDAIVIGGGPAGTSTAISLVEGGARVLLLEEKHMPREKLCGEFLTPECFPTLKRLGVLERVLSAGARKITRLSLAASSGRAVHAPVAEMSNVGSYALSLSRAKLDQILFERAREVGAVCLEGVAVKQPIIEERLARGVEALSLADGRAMSFNAPIIIDASGRNSRLMVSREERVGGRRGSRLYALKAHLQGVEGIDEQVELYFFSSGYGGLSLIEGGLANLCFIASEKAFKQAGGEALKIVQQTILKNSLARSRLRHAEAAGKWLSVGPLTFGPRRLSQAGIIAVGDASGMIDPFTGTGMQIALRSGELAADSIVRCLGAAPDLYSHRPGLKAGLETDVRLPDNSSVAASADCCTERALASYTAAYNREFGKRMKTASLLRGAAFSTRATNLLAEVLARTPRLARLVLRATRSGRTGQDTGAVA